MASTKLDGVAYYPVTPSEDGELSEDRLRERLTHVTSSGDFAGVFPLGSLGEFAYLTATERKRVAEVVVGEVEDETPVYVGVHGTSTREAVEFAEHAEETGADGILLNPHAYYPLTDDEVYAHYKAVHDATSVPLCAYDNPGTTNVQMDYDLFRRIEDLERVEHFKTATPDLGFYRKLALDDRRAYTLFAAPPHMFEKLALGPDGWASVLANFAPEAELELFELATSGDLQTVREAYARWWPLLSFLFERPLAIGLKAALNLQGHQVGQPRPPLQPLSGEPRERLRTLMNDRNLL